MNNDTTKRCGKCKGEFPATSEYFSHNKQTKTGLSCYCNDCSHKLHVDRRRREGKRTLEDIRKDGKKRCPICGLWKELNRDNFYYSRTTKIGFHQYCIQCTRDKSIERHRKEGRFDVKRRYREGEKQCTMCLQWFAANTDNFTKYNRTLDGLHYYCKTCNNAYRKSRRHKYKAHDNNRRARVNNLPNNFNNEDWQFALNYFGGKCAACGRYPDFWNALAQDHWIPLSSTKEGNPGTVAWNIVPLCHSKKGGLDGCNQRKKAKEPFEWLIDEFGKRKGNQIYKRIQDYLEIARIRKTSE